MTELSDWALPVDKRNWWPVTFLGKRFFTDDERLYDYLIQLSTRGKDNYKYDEEGFEREFPGVIEAAISAIRDLESRRIEIGHLVYINGMMQAWCKTIYGDPVTGLPHPPGKLCPNSKLYPVESR